MDPLTLLAVGPTLLRAAGKLFGSRTENVVENIAAIVDEVRGLPASVAQAKIANALAAMPKEDLLELKKVEARLAEIEQEREAARLQADTAQHQAAQETARVEAGSDDEYVRRTRPLLARRSACVTFAYTLLTGAIFPLFNAALDIKLPGPDVWIVSALFSPCLAYMGVRTIDAFSKTGKT